MKQVEAGDEIYVENIQHDYGWYRVQFIDVRVAYSAIKEVR